MKQERNMWEFILCFCFTFLPLFKRQFYMKWKKFFKLVSHKTSQEKNDEITQDSDMQKIYPYWQGRIYACIFQFIWQCKKNFYKTIWGIKSLLFLYNYILESFVDWFLWKQSEIFWKYINFTPLDYIRFFKMPYFMFLRWWIVDFEIEFSKYYLLMANLVKRRVDTGTHHQIWLRGEDKIDTGDRLCLNVSWFINNLL